MRALVLQHDHDAPAGLLAEWAAARGWSLDVARLDLGEEVGDAARYDRVVSLGSEHSADDDTVPWQGVEQATLRGAVAAGVPVLGICFGGQSLARAMGGGVRRAATPEIGWFDVGDGRGPWFEWHLDEIVVPPGAEVLARNAAGVQIWRSGPHVGLQFHPEVDAAIVSAWVDADREVRRAPEGLVDETCEREADARRRAFALFDALVAGR